MPLSEPVARRHIHTRQVECRGYLRDDGLWDVEAHMTDRKTYSFPSEERGEVTAGTPVHDMWIRITVSDDLVIQAIEAVTDGAPYRMCPSITPNFQRLVGLAIRPGFMPKVKHLLGGIEGCTHLVELMGPLATTAFQTVTTRLKPGRKDAEAPKRTGRPRLLETCHAFATSSEVVKRIWPEFYTGGQSRSS